MQIPYVSGNRVVIATKEAGSGVKKIGVFKFTPIGYEMLNLLDIVPNESYLQKFMDRLSELGMNSAIFDLEK